MQNVNTIDWFEVAKFISEIVLTLVAVIVSIIALWQTKKQIQLSNKQALFEHRLKTYTVTSEIYAYCNLSLEMNDPVKISQLDTTIIVDLLNGFLESPPMRILIDVNDISNIDYSVINVIPNKVFIFLQELELNISILFDNNNNQSDLIRCYVRIIRELIVDGTTYLVLYNKFNTRENDNNLELSAQKIKEKYENLLNKSSDTFINNCKEAKQIISDIEEKQVFKELRKQLVLE